MTTFEQEFDKYALPSYEDFRLEGDPLPNEALLLGLRYPEAGPIIDHVLGLVADRKMTEVEAAKELSEIYFRLKVEEISNQE